MPLIAERIDILPGRPPDADAVDTRTPPSARKWKMVAALVFAAAAVGAVAMRMRPLFRTAPSPPIVKASGRVEGREVTIAPKDIQGRVRRLLADEGQTAASPCTRTTSFRSGNAIN